MKYLAFALLLFTFRTPGCSGTPTQQAVPPDASGAQIIKMAPQIPHGIYQVGCDASGAANPHVKGCVLFVPWASVDYGTGLDWNTVETAIAPWAKAQKKVALVIWAVADNVSIHATPDYVLAKLPKQVSCSVKGGTGYAPDFTSANFQTPYVGFLNALVTKYGNDPRIGYVRIGLGAGGEVFPPCKAQLAATYHIGQTDWQSYLVGMIGAVKHSGTVPLMVGLDCWTEPCLAAGDQTVSNAVAAAAIANGWGIGKESLQKSDMLAAQKGQPTDANWVNLFKQNPHAFLDNQMAVGTCANNACPVGSLTVLLPWTKSLGTDVVEVLPADIANPAYASAIAAF